jgi:Ca-activated chloride channel family protein
MKPVNHPLIPLTFLSELATEENSIHPMNSVRMQQGIKHMLKNIITLCCLLLLWFFSDAVLANNDLANEALKETANADAKAYTSLWLESPDGTEKYVTEALSTRVTMSVSGPILRAKVKQTFRNPSQTWLEGVYSFPLPEQAAVDQLRMIVADRIVEGQIKEKQAAKLSYEKARANGQRTSLLSHHRSNIFSTSVANIGPKEEITIEFEYQQVLDFRDQQYNLRFPMVTTPQYTPPRSYLDKDFVEPINLSRSPSDRPGNPISISLDLKPGFPIELPSSISHPISVKQLGEEHFKINLNGSAELSNRDFILSWKFKPSSKPMVSILREDVAGESYGLMMVIPPQASPEEIQTIPRELIWVLDVSGSMQGESIEQARSAMLKALSRLRPEDYFNIIYFNTHAWKFFPNSRAGNVDNLNLARQKILKLEANGGTDMRPALAMALDQNNNTERLRQVIFVTDGAVSNEAELFSEIQHNLGASRLFTIGIGSAPNSYFMRKAALAGRGSFTYISQPQEVNNKIDRLLRKLEMPALTDLAFDLNDPTVSVLPPVLPDVYLGEPVYISFKASNFPHYAELTGRLNGTPSSLRLPLEKSLPHEGIAIEWARRKINELVERHQGADSESKPSIREEALELALEHHQVSKFTSLVAVDQLPERAGGLLNSKRIPANAPTGSVNQLASSGQGIRLAQTATNLPFHLMLGTTLLCLSIVLWSIWFRLIKQKQRSQSWHHA